MKGLNCKAMYLKNIFKKKGSKPANSRHHSSIEQQMNKDHNSINVKPVFLSNKKTRNLTQAPTRLQSKTLSQNLPNLKLNYSEIIKYRQKTLLNKILMNKDSNKQRKQIHSTSFSKNHKKPQIQLSLQKKNSNIDANETKINPTSKYFKQLDNIRLAQKILLAKPSKELSRSTLDKFYNQQKSYRLNVSRYSFDKLNQKRQKSYRKHLNRSKWQ